MDFSCWQAALPKYDVIAVLGRSAVLPGGALIELLGFLLQEKTLRLYLLQYDGEAWRQERDALPRPPRTPATNRRKLTRRAGDSYRPPLPHISRPWMTASSPLPPPPAGGCPAISSKGHRRTC